MHSTKGGPLCKCNTLHIFINMKYPTCDLKLLYETSFKISCTTNISEAVLSNSSARVLHHSRVNTYKDGMLSTQNLPLLIKHHLTSRPLPLHLRKLPCRTNSLLLLRSLHFTADVTAYKVNSLPFSHFSNLFK